ncbi:MAG: DUF4349 domain-containing protein [Gaiellaceae bacterium]
MSRPENENQKDRLEKTASELRKHRPRPSEALVSRVERLAERGAARRPRTARSQLTRRRLVFALAAAMSIATVGAIVHSETQNPSRVAGSGKLITSGTEFGPIAGTNPNLKSLDVKRLPLQQNLAAADATTTTGSATEAAQDILDLNKSGKPASGSDPFASITAGGRLADLRATLLLKVENRDQLSKQTAKAMKIARSFSGYVSAAQVSAPSRGVATSYLELKIPAGHSQDALIAISSLGKILSQEISLDDLKVTVSSQSKQILGIRREIASLKKALDDPSLTAQARSQLQVKLATDRAKLGSLRGTHQETIRRGRLATITVNFTTGDLPKAPSKPSRIHKAIDRAWDGLSSEISWAAIGLIVASPFLLLAALLGLLLRSRRRREERRLLEK